MSDPSPFSSEPTSQQPDRDAALRRVNGPAIGLIVIGAINALGLIGNTAAGVFFDAASMQAQQAAMLDQYGLGFLVSQGFAVATSTLGVVASVVMILGGLKMRALESYGLAFTATILTFVPCVTCCCLITIPFGIWALIVLLDANVKQSFR